MVSDRRKCWAAKLRRLWRYARDSLIGSAHQIWDKVQLYWLTINYGLLMAIIFFFLAIRILTVVPERAKIQEREMEHLRLVPKTDCKKP